MAEIKMSEDMMKYSIPVMIVSNLVAVIGCIINLFTIRFLHTKEQIMGATKILLTAISTVDTIALALPLLMSVITGLIHGENPWKSIEFNDAYSVSVNYLNRLPKYCSNITLLVISIQRLLCVATPHKVKLIFTRKLCMVIILVIPIVLAIVLIPNAVQFESVVRKNNMTGEIAISLGPTRFARNYKEMYLVLNILILIFAICCPLLGITFCNIAFVVFLLRNQKKMLTNKSTNNDGRVREIKTTKIVLTVSIIFVICVSPLGVYLPLRGMTDVNLSKVRYYILISISSTLETINYAANGFVYFTHSAKFRNYLLSVFTCKGRRRNRINPTTLAAQRDDIEERQGPVAGTSTRTGTKDNITLSFSSKTASTKQTNVAADSEEIF